MMKVSEARKMLAEAVETAGVVGSKDEAIAMSNSRLVAAMEDAIGHDSLPCNSESETHMSKENPLLWLALQSLRGAVNRGDAVNALADAIEMAATANIDSDALRAALRGEGGPEALMALAADIRFAMQ